MSDKTIGISMQKLTKLFIGADEKEFRAVDNISLDIVKGEFVTLLGPSGCGKTTTLRMIAGFDYPTEGDIFLDDVCINNLTPDKRETAMVFQSYALFPHCDVYNNVCYGLKIRHVAKEEMDRRVADIIELVGLTGLEKRYPNQLSGGQQQRVALARALIM
ncbi:MAG: ABC transporter ATP-binding protein, partial [Angelakisella sp.]